MSDPNFLGLVLEKGLFHLITKDQLERIYTLSLNYQGLFVWFASTTILPVTQNLSFT